jgi:hypothetical protein
LQHACDADGTERLGDFRLAEARSFAAVGLGSIGRVKWREHHDYLGSEVFELGRALGIFQKQGDGHQKFQTSKSSYLSKSGPSRKIETLC